MNEHDTILMKTSWLAKSYQLLIKIKIREIKFTWSLSQPEFPGLYTTSPLYACKAYHKSNNE
ncbi:hypothetical protein QTP88_014970 [Uroleucon formosanum]